MARIPAAACEAAACEASRTGRPSGSEALPDLLRSAAMRSAEVAAGRRGRSGSQYGHWE